MCEREREGGTADDSNRKEKYALERTAVWCQHCRDEGVGIPVEERRRGVTGKRRDGDCFRMMIKRCEEGRCSVVEGTGR
jgi:hypothetical protein